MLRTTVKSAYLSCFNAGPTRVVLLPPGGLRVRRNDFEWALLAAVTESIATLHLKLSTSLEFDSS